MTKHIKIYIYYSALLLSLLIIARVLNLLYSCILPLGSAKSYLTCFENIQQPAGDINQNPKIRLSLLCARPAVTFPASARHCP